MMKKLLSIVSSAIPALLVIGLVACNKTPVAPPNPDYNPEDNTVKTKFMLSVSTNSPSTKMPASTVQLDGNGFRGIDKVHMLTFSLDYKCEHGDYFMFDPDDDSSMPTRDFDLGSLLTSTDITSSNSSRTVELAVPLSVNAIMLYGIASKTGTDDAQGAVIPSGSVMGTGMRNLSFQLQNRLKDQTAVDGFTGMCNMLAAALTNLTDATLSVHAYGDHDPEKIRDTRYAFWWPIDETSSEYPTRDATTNAPLYNNGYVYNGYTFCTGSKSWQDLGADYEAYLDDPTHAISPLGMVLGRGFYELTRIRTKSVGENQVSELRAGDASSLLRTLRDLSELVERATNATPTSPEEEIARLVGEEILFRIQLFFKADDGELKYRSMGDILALAQEYFKGFEANIGPYVSALSAVENGNFIPDPTSLAGGFPVNLNLPRGAAIMTCARDNSGRMVFGYLKRIPAYGMGTVSLPIENYRFPPELLYWANSGIRVSDNNIDHVPDIPKTVDGWANENNWNSNMWTPNGTISSTTRSVAIMKQLNYGTALLRSTVQAVAPVLNDNRGGIFPGEPNDQITVGPTSFKVTGVFVGGVQDVVGWDFLGKFDHLPEGVASNPYDKMLYDRLSSEISVSTAVSSPIYTLVWDSYRPHFADQEMTVVDGLGTQADQVSVYVALELVNNTGKDFWGEMNLIRNGGTFYLVGKLDITADAVVAQEIEFPDEKYFQYPPFNAQGQTVKIPRVFMQDYMTKASFQIGANSLQHAYMTIPDLRSSQVSLGLSVDLAWEEGLDFAVLLGGN